MTYQRPDLVWSAPSGVKVDPLDPAFRPAPPDPQDESLPAVYLFSNSHSGDGIAYSMAEDGTVLGSHLCSHWGYMLHDLHDRKDRREATEAHYPDGYRIVICGPGEVPPPEVLERNREQGRRKRGES